MGKSRWKQGELRFYMGRIKRWKILPLIFLQNFGVKIIFTSMQINPFESNPKGRKSPLFSSDEESENPSSQQNKLKTAKMFKDINTILPGLLNSQESNNGRSEYTIQELPKENPPEHEFPEYNIPKFLLSNQFATVKQFNKNFPSYSNDKPKPKNLSNNTDGFQIHSYKNSPHRTDIFEKDKSEPSSHAKAKKVAAKQPSAHGSHRRRYSDSTENESYSEKIKTNKKYPSSYEEESIMDFYSDYSNNEPKITRLMTEYSDVQVRNLILFKSLVNRNGVLWESFQGNKECGSGTICGKGKQKRIQREK